MAKVNEQRSLIIYIIILVLAGAVFFNLYTISISDYTKVLPALTNQYTRKFTAAERRGFIFDRNGGIIAGFDDGYNCVVDPSKLFLAGIAAENAAEKIYALRSSPDITKENIYESLLDGKPFVIRIKENTNNEYMTSFQTYKRNESFTPPALHIIGYVDKSGSGVSGIEKAYDDLLKETSSKVDVVYSSNALQQSFGGSPLRIIDYGYNKKTGISLTLDTDLQKKVDEIADRDLLKGAVVVASAATGEILAGASRPVYSLENMADYIGSENGEFVNRVFSSFTPGSVFKTIVAAAALEEDINYYNKEYTCVGEIDAGGKIFKCNNIRGHGALTMRDAYAKSCNTYFMNLALEIGYDKIYAMAKKLGIGENNLLDGLTVQSGNIPEKENPPPAFTANTAIGQGELLITPLEAVRIFCCIANNGVMPELSLVKSFIFDDGTEDVQNHSSEKVLSDDTVKCLIEMTKACVEYGTGSSAAPEYGAAGGKTSSAESGQYIDTEVINEDTGETEIKKVQIVHSWFSGYYPANESPDENYDVYAISIIAEGGVTENIKSANIFKEICDYIAQTKFGVQITG